MPADWRADPAPPDVPDVPVGLRITIDTAAGPLTFPAVDAAGDPLPLIALAGFDADGNGVEELYATEGVHRWRLDARSLRFLDPVAWVDETRGLVVADALIAGWYAGAPVFLVEERGDLRVWDEGTHLLSGPVRLGLDDPDAVSDVFTPSSLVLLHLDPTAGTLLGLDPAGALFAELAPLTMSPYLDRLTTCAEGTPIRPSHLVVAHTDAPTGPFDEALFVVSGNQHYPLAEVRCFGDPLPLVDDDGQPIEPHLSTAVDLDGDGIDDLVWGHK